MTLTPSRPVPAATTPEQQRLELELLLGEPVLGRDQLRPELLGQTVWPLERWRELGACARYNWGALGEWFRREAGTQPVVATGDVGYFAYVSGATTMDMFGLTNRDFALLKARYGSPEVSFFPISVSFASFKKKELGLLLDLAPDYVFLYTVKMKTTDVYPGSASGIAEEPLFRERYDHMATFAISPDFTGDTWPRSIHPIDIYDLSTGVFSWMLTGWGYDVYIKKDSPYPRFEVEVGPDARIAGIRTIAAPAAAQAPQ